MNARHAIAAAAIAATTLPMAANAVVRSAFNSLETCTAAIERTYDGAELTDTFHKRLEDGGHEIYANVELPAEEGDATEQRVTCRTTAIGRTVVELSAADGRWVEPREG